MSKQPLAPQLADHLLAGLKEGRNRITEAQAADELLAQKRIEDR